MLGQDAVLELLDSVAQQEVDCALPQPLRLLLRHRNICLCASSVPAVFQPSGARFICRSPTGGICMPVGKPVTPEDLISLDLLPILLILNESKSN